MTQQGRQFCLGPFFFLAVWAVGVTSGAMEAILQLRSDLGDGVCDLCNHGNAM